MNSFTVRDIEFHVGDRVIIDENHPYNSYGESRKWIKGVVQCIHRYKMCVKLDRGRSGAGCADSEGRGTWSVCRDDHYFIKLGRRKETMPLLTELRRQTSI